MIVTVSVPGGITVVELINFLNRLRDKLDMPGDAKVGHGFDNYGATAQLTVSWTSE